MTPHSATKRKIISTALLFALLVIFLQIDISADMPHPIGSTDLAFFWVGAEVLMKGESPYDAHLYLTRLAELGINFDPKNPPLIWIPPWAFSLIFSFQWFSLSVLSKIWMIISCAIFLFSYALSTTMSQTAAGKTNLVARRFAIVSTISFFPCILCLWLGQLSPVTLFFYNPLASTRAEIKKNLPKPFLVRLLALLLPSQAPSCLSFMDSLGSAKSSKKKWVVVPWFFRRICFLNLAPMIIRPSLYSEYAQNMQHAPLYWKSPTLPSFLSWEFHIESTYQKLLPALLCATIVIIRNFRTCYFTYDYLLLLIPLSILTSPYAWVYDFVLFIPGLVHYSLRTRMSAFTLIACNLLMFSSPSYEMSKYYWYPMVFTLIALLSFSQAKNTKQFQTS